MMDPIETRVMDINAEALGFSSESLMENAGRQMALEVDGSYGGAGGKTAAILCGTGNNGGDGFVVAHHLSQMGWRVRVLLLRSKDEVGGKASKTYLERLGPSIEIIENSKPEHLGDEQIIIDSMLGTGVSGIVREPYRSMILAVNESGKTIISTDVPSGSGTDISIKPDMTITFHDVKTGMDENNSGKIIIKDIGIPPEAVENIGLGDFTHYPISKRESHKGENGRLLIIGGGKYTGAPGLAGLAAFKTGVDLVTIATPGNCFTTIASYSPNFIVKPLGDAETDHLRKDHLDQLMEMTKKADAVLIGPGLGREPDTLETVRELVSKINKPLVIDADALRAFSGEIGLLYGSLSKGVLTPHTREFQALVEREEDSSIMAFSNKTGFTVVLKGNIDLVSDGKQTKKNLTGNPGMTVGGTGDVLAGIVGGLLSKGASPFAAARMGAFLCGAAGDVAFEKLGYSMMATDVIEEIPMVLKTCLRM